MAEMAKIWQVADNNRRKRGRPQKIKNPEDLWNKFTEYCSWVDNNPWVVKGSSSSASTTGKEETEKSGHRSVRQDVRTYQRPYTLYGFCAYIGCGKWADLRRNYHDRAGFPEVMEQIENVVTSYQVEGAMLRQFESNIVARLNGLADKKEVELPIDTSKFDFSKLPTEKLNLLLSIGQDIINATE